MGPEPEWPPSGTDYSSKTQRERPKDEFYFLGRTGASCKSMRAHVG